MDLETGKIYLLHCGYFPTWDTEYYDALVPLVFTHTTHRMDDGIRYYFEDPIGEYRESVDQWSLKDSVFTSTDKFLRFTVYESERVGQKLGDNIIKLIETSRENSPEEWV